MAGTYAAQVQQDTHHCTSMRLPGCRSTPAGKYEEDDDEEDDEE